MKRNAVSPLALFTLCWGICSAGNYFAGYTLAEGNGPGMSSSAAGMRIMSAASITNGLVAYWPLDAVVGSKTPDLVSGYDMTLVNMTAANNLVPGKWGNAMKFDNAGHTLLQRVDH